MVGANGQPGARVHPVAPDYPGGSGTAQIRNRCTVEVIVPVPPSRGTTALVDRVQVWFQTTVADIVPGLIPIIRTLAGVTEIMLQLTASLTVSCLALNEIMQTKVSGSLKVFVNYLC